uniref:Disease resistance protein RGA3 n=1 Tax=Nelumbo nucifera TaxID=4432 RepID=A0A822YSI5_NELNU|nr:TPA_asm: hypothetical protein HUJ06_011039 [Nelumbo nucifera]
MATTADVVVSPWLEGLLNQLDSPWMIKFGSEWGIQEQLIDLFRTLQEAHAMASSTEDMQIRDPHLKLLLKDMTEVVCKATYTLGEFIYEAQRRSLEGADDDDDESKQSTSRAIRKVRCEYFSYSFNKKQLLCRDEIPAVITGIKNELHEVQQKMNHICVASVSSIGRKLNETERKLKAISLLGSCPQSQSVSLVDDKIFGRSEDAEDIMHVLLSDIYNREKVPVISIVGTGGIGKTALAQLIYRDENVVYHFDVRAWVCVSQDSDVTKITRSILESITRKHQAIERVEPLQQELKNWFKGKKLLLVLDDIWSDDCKMWDAVRVPINASAQKGSRIIVTTRFNKVSSIMSAIKRIDLEALSYEHCGELFKRKAFIDDEICNKHPNLKKIGEELVKKCKRAIMPALCLSYYHLPAHLKLCFAYCSLFPKDHKFDKENLIRLWIAEGFITPKEIGIMEDLAGKYFDELLNRSSFQKYYFDNRFVMHDLMHGLAESVSKDMYFRMEESKTRSNSSSNLEKVHYVSMIGVQPKSVEKELYKYKELSTLMFLTSRWDQHILDGLFEQCRCLRVLDLSENYKLINLPNSIGNLKHLQLLNLNQTGIKVLPESLCNLYNLQSLMLKDCNDLIEFPKNMGNLINLQYIVMEDNKWEIFNLIRGIGRLHFLKTLPKFQVKKSNGNNSMIGELKELCHLQGSICLWGLENVAVFEEAKEANLINNHQIDTLELQWDDNNERGSMEGVLEGLQPYTGLKELKINNYGGISFPKWMMMITCYDMLATVKLMNCKKCKFFPPFWNLPSLKVLHISGMKELEHLGKEFYGYSDNNNKKKGFQKLEILSLSYMTGLNEWWGTEEGEFPCLEKLSIRNCPKLMKLPSFLPTVKQVEINQCDMVTSLPRLPSTSKLNIKSYSKLQSLPELQCLTSLQNLEINDCHVLQSLPDLQVFALLEGLEISICLVLQSLPELQGLASLRHLEITNCSMLQSLPGLQGLESLQDLKINDCPMLQTLPELPDFSILGYLEITICSMLQSLPELQGLSQLCYLEITNCPMLQSLPELEGLAFLGYLEITNCAMLQSFPELQGPTSLKHLKIINCPMLLLLPELQELQGVTSLQNLEINDYPMLLRSLPKLQGLIFLQDLKINGCAMLQSLPELQGLTSLQDLRLSDCPMLQSLPELQSLTFLRYLEINNCPMLQSLPKLQGLAFLCYLEIINCHMLQSLPKLQGVASVEHLKIINCPMLQSFPELQGLAFLWYLEITNCPILQSLPGLQSLASLEHLKIFNCPMIRSFPKLQGLTSLQNLEIIDCPILQSLTELQGLVSLCNLTILGCPRLTSLSTGLHKLNFLLALNIEWSNNMKPLLEEELPISLRRFIIYNCPDELRSSLQEGGEDWPKISHIPTIELPASL